jgi:uncharacterized protein YndB with AHSA1/START domain
MNRTSLERTSPTELVIQRQFAAPAHVVFDAWTAPEHVARWWAPASHGVAVVECTVDLRPGGGYRYVLARGPMRLGFEGAYLEVVRPTRLVSTQRFEPVARPPGAAPVCTAQPGDVHITVTFVEAAGVTALTAHERYPSAELLEQVLATGMEGGMRETLAQLDLLVQKISGQSR